MNRIPDCGAVVLCGGESSRMGVDKASLPFRESTMLSCVVQILQDLVTPVCVVASPGQILPELPDGVIVGRDPRSGEGPLTGLLEGFRLLQGRVSRFFCSSCDAPLLQPDVVRLIAKKSEPGEIAAPFDGKFWFPLCAVYCLSLYDRIATASPPVGSPSELLRRSRTVPVSLEELRIIDPELFSLVNVNTIEEYHRALEL